VSARAWTVFALVVVLALVGSLALDWYSARNRVLSDWSAEPTVQADLSASRSDDISIRTVGVGFVREPIAGVPMPGYTFQLVGPRSTGSKTMRVGVPVVDVDTSFRLDDTSMQ